MEDGSALTPLIANHIVAPSAHPIASNMSPALLHLRLLARLSDCPVYLGTGIPNKSISNNGNNNSNNNNSVQSVAQHLSNNNNNNNNNNAAAAGGHSSAMLIETKTNALTIECLRQKPIEQIMQRIPLDLLHLDQTTGDISVQLRWLRTLSQVSQTSNFTHLNYSIDARELNRLILAATKLKLEKEEEVGANLDDGSLDYLKGLEEVNELFGAIYAQPSASMQPVFGPIMDGTIVLNEEMSLVMLKQNSTFAQHDLLIGLSQSTMMKQREFSVATNKTLTDQDQPQEEEEPDQVAEMKLRPDYSVAERITSHLEENGLTNEQAVGMINVFVRSFYRHHNQEITNSIVNHYLNGQSNNNKRARLKGRKQAAYNGRQTITRPISGGNDWGEYERRLALLDSMLEMFQDALKSVPVLKTALIHATKQLEPLMEAFVGREFDSWLELQLSNDSSTSSTPIADFNQQYDQKSALESFIKFAKSLFNDPSWPLELRSPISTNPAPTQPKSTYLYRLESRLPISDLRNFATKFNVSGSKQPANPAWFQRALSNALSALLEDIKRNNNHQIPVSIGCAIDPSLYDDGHDNSNNKLTLFDRIRDKFCARMSLLVSRFVTAGRMSSIVSIEQLDTVSHGSSLIERLQHYESKCLTISDTHSVQPAELDDTILNDTKRQLVDSQTCRTELESLALDQLIEEFERFSKNDEGDQSQVSSNQDQQWIPFNLFTQQVASLFVIREPALLMSQVSHEDTNFADTSQLANPKSTLLARSSFWLNFIPALNCTKTLPIIPNNPQVLMSSSSLLLNLNLQFNCQKGAKTAYNVLESLAASIKQQLLSRINHWLANHSTSSPITSFSQQTFSVANMSRAEHESDQQELLGPENQVSHSNPSLKPSPSIGDLQTNTIQSIDKRNDTSKAFIDLRSRYIAMVLLICGLLIGLTLATGACSVLRQRQNKTNELNGRPKSGLQIQSNLDQVASDDSLLQQQQMSTNLDSNQQTQHSLVHDASKSFAELTADNRQQIIENGADITLTLDAVHYNCDEPRVQLEACEADEQQQACSPVENNHVCTVSNQEDNFVCWTALNANHSTDFLDGSMSLCRSHSSLSGANLISEHEQPIMLPILAKPSTDFQTRVNIKRECLDNSNIDNHFGGSSSETQLPSSGSSTTKKRVKISDPLAAERRQTNRSKAYSYYNKQNNELQTVSAVDTGTVYCPIHLNQSNNSLNMANSGYYVDDRITFLAPNNVELWNNPNFEPAIVGQHYHRSNHQYQERMSDSSFGLNSNAQLNQEQQVIPNGYIVTSTRHRGQSTSRDVNLQNIQ